ncbi:MAG: sterol desaturase family protein [Myxococcales bacterium]|nr:sterol desaturase family protein [Myxococcales bacterium]
MPHIPDPTLYAIPAFIAALLIESVLLRRLRARGRDVLGYMARDTWASLAMGVGSVVFVTLINTAVFLLAGKLYPHRVVDVGSGALGWVVAMLGWDFAFYWHHRWEHEVRLFWACHVNHHSSRYFNFSTALRQPWTPFLGIVLYPPLALVGVTPEMILIAGGLNLIFQFWVHTEAVGKLPRFVELVFNTPSHHRVHHGKNEQYLDKNYAGIFILWDRLFGTFEEERERVVYGLTHDIETYNPLRIAFHEYAAIGRDVARSRSFGEALNRTFRGPGWKPGDAKAR